MRIPASQIAILMQDCRTEFEKLPANFWKNPDGSIRQDIVMRIEPLKFYGNKYASFTWLHPYPYVAIGGRLAAGTDQTVIHFYPKELQVPGEPMKDTLEWFAKTTTGQQGWGAIDPNTDYAP